MAKVRRAKKRTKMPRAVRVQQRGLDQLGAAYARLIMDPCNAPLVHSAYGGAEGTYLVKAEVITDIGVNPDCTNGVYQWIPGVVDIGGVIYGFNGGITGGIGDTQTVAGFAFLRANASAVRCIAACLEITYSGAELNRAGRVAYGHMSGGTLDAAATPTSQVNTMLEHMERTPAGKIEVLWRPGVADGLFHDPNTTVAVGDRERRSAIGVAWSGLPLTGAAGSAGVGLTVRQTAVYEYQPIRGIGISLPTTPRITQNSLSEILRALANEGATYARSTANKVANQLLQAATTGAMGYVYNRARQPRLLNYEL